MTDLSTATATDVVVRMGELVASASAGDVLVCVGLGSCIGLALVCRRGRACGLAHIVLPDSGGREGDRPAKFAERAVPALIGALGQLGVRAESLEAILVGGAQMFSHRAPAWRSAPATRPRCAPSCSAPAFPSRRPRPPGAWAARSACTSPLET